MAALGLSRDSLIVQLIGFLIRSVDLGETVTNGTVNMYVTGGLYVMRLVGANSSILYRRYRDRFLEGFLCNTGSLKIFKAASQTYRVMMVLCLQNINFTYPLV